MKKLLLVLAAFIAVLVFTACGTKTYEIAMITDAGDIDDKSFNQGTYEGIKEYAEENNKSYKYYKPLEVSNTAYGAAIDLAVKGGARIVVTPGFLFEQAVHKAQSQYPDIKFVLIDGSPNNVVNWTTMETYDGKAVDTTIKPNTLSIFFDEQEAGFLAGYASVKEGFTKLGFFGGMAVPAVKRFGIGYVAGAHYAAKEDNVTISFPVDRYHYFGDFKANDTFKQMATSWYNSGTEIIHAAAGGAGNSVMTAAQDLQGKWVVGVDVDQKDQSPRVITSAMKGLVVSVQKALTDFYANKFEGGKSITLGAAENAVGLPNDFSRFTKFNKTQYDAIFAKIVNGEVVVPTTSDELNTFATAKGFALPEGMKAKIEGSAE